MACEQRKHRRRMMNGSLMILMVILMITSIVLATNTTETATLVKTEDTKPSTTADSSLPLCTDADFESTYTDCKSLKDSRKIVYFKVNNCSGGVEIPISDRQVPCSKFDCLY